MDQEKFKRSTWEATSPEQTGEGTEKEEAFPQMGTRVVVGGNSVKSEDPNDQVLIERGFLPARNGGWTKQDMIDKSFLYEAQRYDRRPFELMGRWTDQKVVFRQNDKGGIEYWIMSDEALKNQAEWKELPYGSDRPS